MTVTFLERSIWQRIFGISATGKPQDENGWRYESGQLIISLDRIPELTQPGTAVRFEGKSLPVKILVVFGEDKQYRVFHNRCTHLGHRRLDYVPGTETVQCCSVGKSTYTFDGDKIHGPAPQSIRTFPVEVGERELRITIS
ncbi:MAG: Rieske (2Fe-2S) protein [Desulfobacterales bacterium]|jgi:nitrite reductase/ring-hydroxylating ferredoxin subunit